MKRNCLYEPIFIATIKLLLRRTLVRLVILIIACNAHCCYQSFTNLNVSNIAPTGH